MSIFCHKCGNKIEEDSTFCIRCGTSVEVMENTDEHGIDIEKVKKTWSSFEYVWVVIVNLITVGVVIAIFSSIYDSFEVIVISLLILIYLSIQTFVATWGNATVTTAFYNHEEFLKIRKLLRNDSVLNEDDVYEDECENEEFEVSRKKFDKAKIKMYINMGFAFIIYIIVIINLLGAL